MPKKQKAQYETEKKHKTEILEESGADFSFTSGASTSFILIGLATDEEHSNDSLHDTKGKLKHWLINSCTRSHWSHPQRLLN